MTVRHLVLAALALSFASIPDDYHNTKFNSGLIQRWLSYAKVSWSVE